MTSNGPIISTNYGPVQGEQRQSSLGYQFYSFRGIPYAKPPIENLRFKDPVPIEPWTCTFKATKEGCAPIQMNFSTSEYLAVNCDEDCLVLNVYTKELTPLKPLPVMIWIYGGAYRTGSSEEHTYSPEFLLQKDIVFISFNYRLGPLGFLSIDDQSVEVPGNAGLKDQTLALRWARENVRYFGGDDKNITIFGESAGASSVHFHMISDHSKDLFDKGIAMSGVATSDWCNIPRHNWAERLAGKLGWDGSPRNAKEYFEFLKNADPIEMTKQAMKIITESLDPEENKLFNPFAPCIEPYKAPQSFLTKAIHEIYQTSWGNNIPLMLGATSEEALLFQRTLKNNPTVTDEHFQYLVPNNLGYGLRHTEKCKTLGSKIKQFYYGTDEPSANNINVSMQLATDLNFWKDIYNVVKCRVEAEAMPTYFYRFNFKTIGILRGMFVLTKENIYDLDAEGASHADDIVYLFKNDFIKDITTDSRNYKLMQEMVSIYTNFAAKGDPNGLEIQPIVWKPADKSDRIYKVLNISDNLSFIDLPEIKQVEFWNSLK